MKWRKYLLDEIRGYFVSGWKENEEIVFRNKENNYL